MGRMKFAVDCMLGRLAKWLKILGFDAVFFPKIEDDELLDFARKEERVLLTRDTGLLERADPIPCLFIESDLWKDQIRQVLDHFGLRDEIRPHTRCLRCNRVLLSLPKGRARNLVTSYVYQKAEKFALCPDCGRVYWRGTHLKDMEDRLRDIAAPSEPEVS